MVEELSETIFNSDVDIKTSNEFFISIFKTQDRARIKVMISRSSQPSKHSKKNFTYGILFLEDQLYDTHYILDMLLRVNAIITIIKVYLYSNEFLGYLNIQNIMG